MECGPLIQNKCHITYFTQYCKNVNIIFGKLLSVILLIVIRTLFSLCQNKRSV